MLKNSLIWVYECLIFQKSCDTYNRVLKCQEQQANKHFHVHPYATTPQDYILYDSCLCIT